MRKLLFGLAVCFATALSAQQYPGNGWGNEGPDSGYNNDNYYFPDDYYYEFPTDYYADDYYRNFYSDYRQSLQMINWKNFYRDYRLSNHQIARIIDLNNQFSSFNVWNSYYRANPQRWYYDRYYALEQILGPKIFIVFQNNYYEGYSPVTYYHNRWENFYRPRYNVRPSYVNININFYKVNRQQYHQSVGSNYGWNQTRSNNSFRGNHANGNFRNNNTANTTQRNDGRNTANTDSRGRNSAVNTTAGTRNTSLRASDASINTVAQPRVRNYTPRSNTGENTQTPRTRSVRSAEPQRNTGFSNRANTSTRSSGDTNTRASSSSSGNEQRNSTSGSRGTRGARN